MSSHEPVLQWSQENLNQLSLQELVQIILAQQEIIEQLSQEIERLRVSRDLDSQTSSKPPSTDLLKKSEKGTGTEPERPADQKKRKPGGQPGHPGKTRQGFSRIDRREVLRPQQCSHCGQNEWESEPVKVEVQQVAELVERPIEVVEDQRHHCQCRQCGHTMHPHQARINHPRTRFRSQTPSSAGMARELRTSALTIRAIDSK